MSRLACSRKCRWSFLTPVSSTAQVMPSAVRGERCPHRVGLDRRHRLVEQRPGNEVGPDVEDRLALGRGCLTVDDGQPPEDRGLQPRDDVRSAAGPRLGPLLHTGVAGLGDGGLDQVQRAVGRGRPAAGEVEVDVDDHRDRAALVVLQRPADPPQQRDRDDRPVEDPRVVGVRVELVVVHDRSVVVPADVLRRRAVVSGHARPDPLDRTPASPCAWAKTASSQHLSMSVGAGSSPRRRVGAGSAEVSRGRGGGAGQPRRAARSGHGRGSARRRRPAAAAPGWSSAGWCLPCRPGRPG